MGERLVLVGGGQMGGALVRGFVRAGVLAQGAVTVVEPHAPTRETWVAEGWGAVADAAGLEAGTWLLAVKPQLLESVVRDLAPQLGGALAISVAAGVSLDDLAAWAPAARWVRSMPNQPALVGAGATGLVAAPEVSAAERERVETLFAAVGRAVWLGQESLMHAVTGLSGSGPAFVALVAEALEDAGVDEGLPRALARELALATLAGAARQMQDEALAPAQLKERVTSPGGTTIAGLRAAEQQGLKAAVMAAVAAATARSKELEER